MRDRRLDFWRGLCLIDMVLVHLVWEGLDVGPLLAPLISEYTRFAAGGFVFVSGVGVALVFLPRARADGGRFGVRGDLWRRAAYVLGVHYAAAASFVALEVTCGARNVDGRGGILVRDLLMLRTAPPYGDILPLYVVLLVVAPALIELMRRGRWPVVALGSGALFVAGQWHPWLFSPRAPEEFPVIVWQAVFVAGLFFGGALPRLDRAPRRVRLALLGAAAGAFAAVSLAAHGADLGLPIPASLSLRKVPLNAPELIRYLALTLVVVLGTGLAWNRLERRAIARFVEALGRRSLGVYVAHVWVQAMVTAVAGQLPWLGSARVVLALVALLVLSLVARGLESSWPARPVRRRIGARLRRGAALPAGALATVLLVTPFDRGPVRFVDDGEFVADVEAVELDAGATAEHETDEPPAAANDAPGQRGNDEARLGDAGMSVGMAG